MTTSTLATIEYADFAKLEIKVGQVLEASCPEWSNKLVALTVDFGQAVGQRTILAGIRKWYEPAALLNKKFLFIVNLAPKKMGEAESQGMMLVADTQDEAGQDLPTLIEIPTSVAVGTPLG